MTYTVRQAKTNLARLLREAEEGKEVIIDRGKKPAVRLTVADASPGPKRTRIAGKYAGQHQYSDGIFKPLETDEELREYGFDLLIGGIGSNVTPR
jgi:antitoxin (DNA-binding transcriptional repressor) of toxin-antitoxin stability system